MKEVVKKGKEMEKKKEEEIEEEGAQIGKGKNTRARVVVSTVTMVTAGATGFRKLECSTGYYDAKGSEEETEVQQCSGN